MNPPIPREKCLRKRNPENIVVCLGSLHGISRSAGKRRRRRKRYRHLGYSLTDCTRKALETPGLRVRFSLKNTPTRGPRHRAFPMRIVHVYILYMYSSAAARRILRCGFVLVYSSKSCFYPQLNVLSMHDINVFLENVFRRRPTRARPLLRVRSIRYTHTFV